MSFDVACLLTWHVLCSTKDGDMCTKDGDMCIKDGDMCIKDGDMCITDMSSSTSTSNITKVAKKRDM